MTEKEKEKKSEVATVSMGLPKNTASALCYGLGWVTGLIFLFMEKDKEVRFHALQSIGVFGGLMVIQIVLGSTVILARLSSLIGVGMFILWLMLIYKTYHGEKWVLPYVGGWAEKQVGKMK